MNDSDSEVHIQVQSIQKQLWLVLFSATAPFFVLAIAGVLTKDSTEEKLLISSAFIFSFGLALLTTKVASHTAVGRHLKDIEKINEMKSEFISVAAHQLKTPISAFTYSLDSLGSAYKKNDMQTFEIFLQDLQGSAHRLGLLARNLLNVTLLNDEASTVHLETFPLRPRIEEMLEHLDPVRVTQSVELNTDIGITKELVVCCDTGLFYHVLENLLTNAFKYGEKQQPVRLCVEEKEYAVAITVCNTTHSMKQADLETLFQKYKRSGGAKTAKSNGFGLGLYITKKFVESWGGEVSVRLHDATDEICFSCTVLKPGAPGLEQVANSAKDEEVSKPATDN